MDKNLFFATTFIFWLLLLIGILFFAVMFGQKKTEEDEARAFGLGSAS